MTSGAATAGQACLERPAGAPMSPAQGKARDFPGFLRAGGFKDVVHARRKSQPRSCSGRHLPYPETWQLRTPGQSGRQWAQTVFGSGQGRRCPLGPCPLAGRGGRVCFALGHGDRVLAVYRRLGKPGIPGDTRHRRKPCYDKINIIMGISRTVTVEWFYVHVDCRQTEPLKYYKGYSLPEGAVCQGAKCRVPGPASLVKVPNRCWWVHGDDYQLGRNLEYWVAGGEHQSNVGYKWMTSPLDYSFARRQRKDINPVERPALYKLVHEYGDE